MLPKSGVWLLLGPICVLAIGCRAATTPDPNDPNVATAHRAEVLHRNLHWASDAANARVYRGEISSNKAKDLVAEYASELTSKVKISQVHPDDAWIYGDLFLTAKNWDMAKQALTIAVAHAKDEDRRVNDSLRLAQAYGMLNDVPKAIALAKTTFSAPPTEKAPILPAILLTVVPAARGKGHDEELARLLEGAIKQHELTIVDPKLAPGKAFLMARPVHIAHAWDTVVQLYNASGHADEAEAAQARRSRQSQETARA